MAGFTVGDWRGQDVYLTDGGKLGRLEDVYYAAETDAAAFLCVRTGTFTHTQTWVPVRDVHAITT